MIGTKGRVENRRTIVIAHIRRLVTPLVTPLNPKPQTSQFVVSRKSGYEWITVVITQDL